MEQLNNTVEKEKCNDETIRHVARGPLAGDIMPFISLISKFGVDNFKKVFTPEFVNALVDEQGNVNLDVERISKSVGMVVFIEIVQIITERLPKCEVELFTFISRFTELTYDEVMVLPIDELLEIIFEIVNHKNFKGFTKVASKFL